MNYRKKPEKPPLPEMYGFRATERVYIKGIPNKVYQVCNFVDGLVVLIKLVDETIDDPLRKRKFEGQAIRIPVSELISYDKETALNDTLLDNLDNKPSPPLKPKPWIN